MAKRIKVCMPNGNDSIEIWDNELDNFLAKGYKSDVEKKPTIIKPKVVEIKKEEIKEQS